MHCLLVQGHSPSWSRRVFETVFLGWRNRTARTVVRVGKAQALVAALRKNTVKRYYPHRNTRSSHMLCLQILNYECSHSNKLICRKLKKDAVTLPQKNLRYSYTNHLNLTSCLSF